MSLEIKEKKGIKTWYYDMRVNNKRYRGWLLPISKMTRKKAKDELQGIKANIITQGSPFGPENQITGATLVKRIFKNYEDYLEAHRPNTHASVKYLFKKFAFFHNDKIGPEDIIAYKKLRLSQKAKNSKRKISGATVNRELQYCRSAFNRAIKDRLIKHNPFDGFDHYEEHERTRYLTENELGNLLNQSAKSKNPDLKNIIITAILTGMRKREILKLHKDQINFALGTITIEPEGEKNNKRKVIPIPEPLIGLFRAKIEQNGSGYIFENTSTQKPYDDVKKAFWKALENAKISNFRFHDLRHTFATYALLTSKDLRAVQETLGHKRVSTTQKYAHVLAEQKRNLIDQTSNFFVAFMDKKTDKKKRQARKHSRNKGAKP